LGESVNIERDDTLRGAFRRLRDDVAPRTPDANRMLRDAEARRGRAWQPGLAFAGFAAILATVAVVVAMDARWSRPRVAARDIAAAHALAMGDVDWRAPTDFLLDTPGAELTRTTPSFDTGITPLRDPRRHTP
jgi:hypothetical protein